MPKSVSSRGLKGEGLPVQWVERITLKDLMPDAKSVFKQLFTELSIQEPAFNDTIILYRRDANVKKAEQEDEKKPIKTATDVTCHSHPQIQFLRHLYHKIDATNASDVLQSIQYFLGEDTFKNDLK